MKGLLIALLALTLSGALAPTALASDQSQLRHVLGGSCPASGQALGYRTVCRHGSVVKLVRRDKTVQELRNAKYTLTKPTGPARNVRAAGHLFPRTPSRKIHRRGNLLLIRSQIRKAEPKLHMAAVPPANCTDNRVRLDPDGIKGIAFHSWSFKVNYGQAQTITWQSGSTFASGEPGRMPFEIVAAWQDWQGFRNPSPGSAPARYASGSEGGCSFFWSQQQNPPADPNLNLGRIAISFQGDTLRVPSGEAACHGGGGGFADGESTVSAANWTCSPGVIAETAILVNGQGYIVEADMSFNNAVNGVNNTTWCYRFTAGCISLTSLANNPSMVPFEDLARHELGHVLDLDHTCGTQNCSHNTMDVDYAQSEWPRDIGLGDKNGEHLIYH